MELLSVFGGVQSDPLKVMEIKPIFSVVLDQKFHLNLGCRNPRIMDSLFAHKHPHLSPLILSRRVGNSR